MTREEFVKQRCEIDKITEEEFEKTYRVVDCNCGAYYCKGYRCLDLDDLLKENQKYKEVIDKATNELFILKDMIYKPETREENFEIQRKISSIIKRLNSKEVSE